MLFLAPSKVTDAMIKALISEGDKAEIISLYTDFFNTPDVADSVPLHEQHATINIQLGDKGGDLGVEVEATMPPETLATNLGFSKGLPLLFNHYRHRAGLSAWNSANDALFSPEAAATNPEMERLSLHWHQLVGLHSIIRSNFSPEPVLNKTFGCLIADEVGLGKTFLSALIVAFLSDVVTRQSMLQQSGPQLVTLPPVISKSNSLPRLTCH